MTDAEHTSRFRHDLKNQLGIVLGYAELLLQDMEESNPLRADIEEILRAGQQAMALVDGHKEPA